MKFFFCIGLFSFFATVDCCTERKAYVKIINNSGKKILAETLVHRYSTDYTDSTNFTAIENNGVDETRLEVRYNTGFACNGNDWWLITWVADDYLTYTSDPNNGQCWISIAAELTTGLIGAFSSIFSVIEGPLAVIFKPASAILQLTSTITQYTINKGDFCGFKAYTLSSDDANKDISIYLYSYKSNGVKWVSPSGSATTDSKILDVCPGFSEKPNVNFDGNNIGDLANIPQAPTYKACCNRCYTDKQCQSYTWDSGNHNCFLKTYSSGIGQTNSIFQSGVRQGM